MRAHGSFIEFEQDTQRQVHHRQLLCESLLENSLQDVMFARHKTQSYRTIPGPQGRLRLTQACPSPLTRPVFYGTAGAILQSTKLTKPLVIFATANSGTPWMFNRTPTGYHADINFVQKKKDVNNG